MNATSPTAAPYSGTTHSPRSGTDTNAPLPTHPSDILLECVLGFLTPLLMAGCSCDLGHARMAAIETLASYQARTQAELVKIAQIIGFGLIAMDNLRLSMADVSLSMRLRLRGGANALNRSAQQNHRALEKSRCGIPRQPGPAEPSPIPTHFDTMSDEDAIDEASVQTAIAQAETMVKAAHARIEASQRGPRRAPLQAESPRPSDGHRPGTPPLPGAAKPQHPGVRHCAGGSRQPAGLGHAGCRDHPKEPHRLGGPDHAACTCHPM